MDLFERLVLGLLLGFAFQIVSLGLFVHWHLDGQYLGETKTFHQQALDISPGRHVVTLVDKKGNRRARRFEVLQVLLDPEGDHDWYLAGEIDLTRERQPLGPLIQLTRIGS